jgi:hypothetical protein
MLEGTKLQNTVTNQVQTNQTKKIRSSDGISSQGTLDGLAAPGLTCACRKMVVQDVRDC